MGRGVQHFFSFHNQNAHERHDVFSTIESNKQFCLLVNIFFSYIKIIINIFVHYITADFAIHNSLHLIMY